MEKIKELDQVFTRKGWTHRQVYYDGEVYVYEKTKEENGVTVTVYEVFRRKVGKAHPRYTGDETMVVRYPSNESFGSWAYCVTRMGQVKKFIEELNPDPI